jgi:hypothetical protein
MKTLEQFFGAWFHQDWQLDADSWQSVARQFAASDGSAVAVAAADSILALVQSEPSDTALAGTLSKLGCEYWPGAVQDLRPWLVALAHELRQVAGS